MHREHRSWAAALSVIFAAAVCGQACLAQGPAASASRPADIALDQPYVDGSFGFSITPPAGATVYKQKRFVSKADLEIVQFANESERWSLSVRLTTTTQPLDADTITEGITANLSERFGEVKVITAEPQRIAGREGVRYSASFFADRQEWLRQQAVIRTKPTEYYALVFITPLAARDLAVPAFDCIVASFQIVRGEAAERRIQDALQRGKQLLQAVARREIKLSQRLRKEHWLGFVLDGKEIGFVQVLEQARPQGSSGVIEIREWAWLFNPDGSVVHMRHDISLAEDLSSENWENRVLTLLPEQQGQARQAVYNYDSGIRTDDQLLVAYMPEPNSPTLVDKVIEVDKSYASAAWHALWPRLIDLSKPELYAFSTYSAERRGLVLRALEVVGPTQIGQAGGRTPAIKLESSEGLVPPISEIDVNKDGAILRVIAGQLEMRATTREAAEKTYGTRVKEAQEILKRIPIRQPTPTARERPMKPDVPRIVQPPPQPPQNVP